ncbi:type VII secretion target [Saccharopolyspora shandongensis]|uniref:type VII secretion target n=1 Tax=Saccharopolyspora shandongensis TaxID=418495 RepID=UPI00341F20D4
MTFEVVAEELTAHASHLDGLTDRLDTAISAAETVSMSDEAYGILCSFLPPIVNPMEKEGLDALNAAKEGVSTTADNVRATAKQYEETDQASADSFSPLEEDVEVRESAVALRGTEAPSRSMAGRGTDDAVTAAQQAPTRFSMAGDEPLARQAPTGFSAPEGETVARQAPTGFSAPEGETVARQAPTPFNLAEGETMARQAPAPFNMAEGETVARQAPTPFQRD